VSGAVGAGVPKSPSPSGSRRLLFGLRATARFGWRVTLVQYLANAVVIGLLIVVLPGFELHASHGLLAVLWLAAVFGLVSALVRPTLEFLFLPYVLQTLGLVMVAINAILLALLALTRALEIRGIVALLAGAVLAGVVGFVLDGVLGLTPPVVDDPSGVRLDGPARSCWPLSRSGCERCSSTASCSSTPSIWPSIGGGCALSAGGCSSGCGRCRFRARRSRRR
jgi:putative membrane protein